MTEKQHLTKTEKQRVEELKCLKKVKEKLALQNYLVKIVIITKIVK